MPLNLIIYLILAGFLATACVTESYPYGFFPWTEKIVVTANSTTSIRWITSPRDAELIILVSTQTIRLNGNQIDSSLFSPGVNTKYWRLSFGVTGSSGYINPTTDLSGSMQGYTASAGLPAGGPPYYCLIWSYDQYGNLVRSSDILNVN